MKDAGTHARHRIVKRLRQQFDLPRSGPASIYVLHFTPPYIGHARHYVGYTGRDVATRLATHRSGHGSKLVRALLAHGGDFVLALTFKLPLCRARGVERRIKNCGSGLMVCPYCADAAMVAKLAANRGSYRRRVAAGRVRTRGATRPPSPA